MFYLIRCQWFIDYCNVKDICTKGAVCKTQPPDFIVCEGGSLNQCTADPSLCQAEGGYCVELDDVDPSWSRITSKKGDGFSCIDKKAFKRLSERDQFCNFNKTDHVLGKNEKGYKPPNSRLDACCYAYLICIDESKGCLFCS